MKENILAAETGSNESVSLLSEIPLHNPFVFHPLTPPCSVGNRKRRDPVVAKRS